MYVIYIFFYFRVYGFFGGTTYIYRLKIRLKISIILKIRPFFLFFILSYYGLILYRKDQLWL